MLPGRKQMVAIAVTGLCFIGGNVAWHWLDGRRIEHSDASVYWPSADGLIVEARLETRGNRDLRIVYEYVVGDRAYRNDIVRFDQAQLTLLQKEALVASYSQGQPVSVYFNPERPNQSVLVRGSR